MKEPKHPGEVLVEKYLIPNGYIVDGGWILNELVMEVDEIHWPHIDEFAKCRRHLNESLSIGLKKRFKTRKGYWEELQRKWDVYHQKKQERLAV